MRAALPLILIVMTLFTSTAHAHSPAPTGVQSALELRQIHEAQTLAANTLLKKGYFSTAETEYRSLAGGLSEELEALHTLHRTSSDGRQQALIEELIQATLNNLDSVIESRQLIRVVRRDF